RADQFGQPRFDVHVDVFELCREPERAGLDLCQDRVQPVSDFFLIGRRNDARLRQHLAVGDRAANILRVELPVEADRRVDRFHDRGRTRGKTSAPHLVAGLVLAHRYNPFCGVTLRMAKDKKFFPAPRLVLVALVAGVLAGAVAVYVTESGSGNNPAGSEVAAGESPDDIACAPKAERAKTIAAAATGQVAALLPADPPQSLKGLA